MWHENGTVKIQYEMIGSGVPVLLLHGYEVDKHLMQGCFEPVFENTPGFMRIYPDLPGMGQSRAGSIKNAPDMLAALVQFVTDVVPGPFLLCGESYGGYLAQALCGAMPQRVKGLVLMCSVVHTEDGHRELPQRRLLLQQDIPGISPQEKAQMEALAVQSTPDVWHRFKAGVLPGLNTGDKAFLASYSQPKNYMFAKDVNVDESFEHPALIIAGKQDDVVGYADALRVAKKLPRASFAVLDMAGHNLQIEQPALFAALVTEWLRRTQL